MVRTISGLRGLILHVSCVLIMLMADARAAKQLATDADSFSQMFDASLLRGGTSVELSNLLSDTGGGLPPGTYPFDILINRDAIGKQDVQLIKADGSMPKPCLTSDLILRLGIVKTYTDAMEKQGAGPCFDLNLLDEHARVFYDAAQMQMHFDIPQALLERGRRGFVDESLWDHGVNAGFVNYRANSFASSSLGRTSRSSYLGLINGLNLGGWRLRNESNLTQSNGASTKFMSNRTFAQHDVTRLKSQFSAGELYSGSDVFNSLRFRGIQLASDEAMLADSERGFAPVIRGVADTNATVEVRQNGYLLTTVSVPPGPFAISDIYPNGSNGDMDVTVIEADGRRQIFRQAFSILPLMVQRGRLRYSADLGQYKSTASEQPTPTFGAVSGVYGLTENLSLVGGVQASSGYQAINMGFGGNTPIGALSFDLTHSRSKAAKKTLKGQSLRALYSKTLSATSTTFTLAAYRYSTEKFRTFENHIHDVQARKDGWNLQQSDHRSRSRLDLTINQTLGKDARYGSVFLNSTHENYWNSQNSTSISAGYGNNWGRVAYNINFQQSKVRNTNGKSESQNRVMLSLSIPLGRDRYAPTLYMNGARSSRGTASTTGLSGYVPGMEHTNYSLQASRGENGDNSGSIGLSSALPLARVGGSFSTGRDFHSYNVSAAGAIVAHAGGVNLTREVGDSFALVHVDGVKDVSVGEGLPTVGYNSYVVYPNAQPYRMNTIALNVSGMGADTELDSITQTVVPRRGAIVAATFKGTSGRRVQMRFHWPGGKLPIGAAVEDEAARQVGLIDQSGQALLLLAQDAGKLSVRWQEGLCQVNYSLPERLPDRYYDRLSVACE
ncbi:fimbria/pilus outer membrane usher protein [Achromobacter seleniivolatilans]|uniref:Fimbria/pilus outer membrane usher protein n=1 Tax=Achromobacter seleniivolatilans TaxID=3047478 RepID=A0ABY9LV23_9BURK|nr:fimbria/pilus outer membrane usher protein [Achromobacter sp. R39]WMD18310.1 fimbria/pilus outer membrane usher protein [Achromobacter sp. R39]